MPRLTGEIQRLTRCMRQYKNALLEPYEIGSRTAQILNFVHLVPDCSQEKLAEHLILDKSTVARRLASLEERGYLIRIPNPNDRRGQIIRLTEKAEKLIPIIQEVNEKWFAFLTEGEDPAELEQTERMLCKMLDKAKRYLKEAEQA